MAVPGATMIPLPQTPISPLQDTPRIVITPSHRESSMPGGHDHTMDACVTCEITGEPFNEKHNKIATTPDRTRENQRLYSVEPADPTNMNAPFVQPTAASHPAWIHKLFDCHCITCLEGCFSPCTLYGKTQYRLENAESGIDTNDLTNYTECNLPCWLYCIVHFTTLGCCGLMKVMQHSEVRETYSIEGDLFKDFCKGWCCGSCTLMQADREVRTRGKHPLPQSPRVAFSLWKNSKYDHGRHPSQPGLKPQMVYAPSQGLITSRQEQAPLQSDNTYFSEKTLFHTPSGYQQNKDIQEDCGECQNAEGSYSPSHRHGQAQDTGIDVLSLETSALDYSRKDEKNNRRKLQKKYTKPNSAIPDEESAETEQEIGSSDSVVRRNRTMSLGNLKQKAKDNGNQKPAGCPFDNPNNFKYWTGGNHQTVEFNTRDNHSPPTPSFPGPSPLSQEHSTADRENSHPHKKSPLVGHSLNDCPSDAPIRNEETAVTEPDSKVKDTAEQIPLPLTPQHDLEDCEAIPDFPQTPGKRLSQHDLDDCFGQRIFSKPPPPSIPEHNLIDCDTDLIDSPSVSRKTVTVPSKAYHAHGLAECAPDEAVFIYYGDGKPQKHTIKECVMRKSDSGADYIVLYSSGPSTPMTVTAAREHGLSQDEITDAAENSIEDHLRRGISHVPGSYRSEIITEPKKKKSVQNLLSGLSWKQTSALQTESTIPLDSQGDSTYDSSVFTNFAYARSSGNEQKAGTDILPGRSNDAKNKGSWVTNRGNSTVKDKSSLFGSQDRGWGSKWRYGKKVKALGPAFWDGESEP